MSRVLRLCLVLAILLAALPLSPVSAQDPNPWNQVFDQNGNLRSDVVDLGVTTDTPSWMKVDLPLGQSLQLDANYHRFQTAEGNMVVLPSASTLFFMAMNPQESGLTNSAGMMSNGYGSIITFLGQIAGNSLDWNRVQQERPQYKDPNQFWNAVLTGQESAWTWFSGWGFITNLLSMSWNDAAMRSAYLLYLNGAKNCATIPGGCSGVIPTPTTSGLSRSGSDHPATNLEHPEAGPSQPAGRWARPRKARRRCAGHGDDPAGDLFLARTDLRRRKLLPGCEQRRDTQL